MTPQRVEDFLYKNTWQPNHQTMGKFFWGFVVCIYHIPSPSLTWNLKTMVSKLGISYSRGAIFRWTMLNFGRVTI